MPDRIPQVNKLIKKELSQIVLKEVEMPPSVLLTLTRVETTPNLIESRIFISVMPEEKQEATIKTLNRQIYGLQQQLNKRLKMRPIPKIIFVKERETIKAGRVEEILERLKKRKK
jgi:ribosome-binding factor A